MIGRVPIVCVLLLLVCSSPARADQPVSPHGGACLPAAWLRAWSNPPAADRPRQIVHGIGAIIALPEGVPQVIKESGPDAYTVDRLSCYKDRGLGGVVCNVAFQNYLRSEENWKTLRRAVKALAKLGMVVWIYDEEGYPSGAAGGLVLKANPEYEATELAFDTSRPDPFLVRRAYEFTHASNNFYAARRYINLIDDRAVRSFIANTHEAYYKRLGPYFGTTVQATFTDEPSLITIDVGPLHRKVIDPTDPTVRPLPAVPWCYDLPQRFRDCYHRDLLPLRRSLFTGNSPEDRETRRQFWSLIADLVAERYFGAIQTWCAGSPCRFVGAYAAGRATAGPRAAGRQCFEGVGPHGRARFGHAHFRPRAGRPRRLADGCPSRLGGGAQRTPTGDDRGKRFRPDVRQPDAGHPAGNAGHGGLASGLGSHGL